MSEPFMGQICAFGFDFAPRGWAKCDGQLLLISQYSALFSLLGTQYGGDGRQTFGLPNLMGRTIFGSGDAPYRMGISAGQETVTLSSQQMPSHRHDVTLTSLEAKLKGLDDDGDTASPNGATIAKSTGETFSTDAPNVEMHADSIEISGTGTCENTGGNVPHENRPPFLVLNYCIALMGLFPSRP